MATAFMDTEVAIVGGGIAGLTLGFWLTRRGVDVQVFEARDRVGGNIRSEQRKGYRIEWGPNGFLDNEPATLRLVDALDLSAQLTAASDAYGRRWLVRNGILRALPTSPLRFLTSDVLSLPGRLRVLLEWAQRAKRDDQDESVFEFASRRIGREAAEVLVDAMVTGVYAGDARKLSLHAAFPRMREMEATHGGLVRAMIARARQARREASSEASSGDRPAPRKGGPMGPGGTLTSFEAGAESLVVALHSALSDRVHLDSPVRRLDRSAAGWTLGMDAASVRSRHVVLSCPSWRAAPLVEALDAQLAHELEAIPSSPVAIVAAGFDERSVSHVERGFGFLVPGVEQLPVLGTLFDSWVFPQRAPDGKVLWRSIIGGAREPDAIDESDEQLVRRTLSTLDRLLGVRDAPEMTYVVRHPRGIPQYRVGHRERIARVDQMLAHLPGLHVAGNSYHGIAMNACIKHAEQLAEQLAGGQLTGEQRPA